MLLANSREIEYKKLETETDLWCIMILVNSWVLLNEEPEKSMSFRVPLSNEELKISLLSLSFTISQLQRIWKMKRMDL